MKKHLTLNLTWVAILFVLTSYALQAQTARKKQPAASVNSPHFARHTFKSDDGQAIDYWLMTPAIIEDGRKYPLVLSLHGRGGSTVAAKTLGKENNRKKYPCFVMAPRVDTSDNYWARPKGFELSDRKPKLSTALQAMDTLVNKLPIDTNRVYDTGQSMGGGGTFGAIVSRPNTFAAAIPIASGWDPEDARKIKHIPIWIFHGDADKRVPTEYSRKMSEALQAAGGNPKYTEYPGVSHNSWTRTYDNPATFDWLFKQER
jgi:predicted peptidase